MPIRIRKVVVKSEVPTKESKTDLSPLIESKTGLSAVGELPWVQHLIAAHLDPTDIPQGLPEMPPILPGGGS